MWCEKKRFPTTVLKIFNDPAFLENSMNIFKQKVRLEIPWNLAILLLGFYPKCLKNDSEKVFAIPMFIATLVTISKIWKKPISKKNEIIIYIIYVCHILYITYHIIYVYKHNRILFGYKEN